MRLPNVFTAMADIFMGFWLTHETLSPVSVFVLLLISSSCLYTAGMVLNDVFDEEQDRRERPQRPIPSGRIPMKPAKLLSWTLMIGGIAIGVTAAALSGRLQPVIAAAILAALILFYDLSAKRTEGGTVVMGACRAFNVVLGMSASLGDWDPTFVLPASGIGMYVIGVTWFARREATVSQKNQLIIGFCIILLGMGALYWATNVLPWEMRSSVLQPKSKPWILLWIALSTLIGWRFVRAIIWPEPALVQAAVKSGILAIIVLDAVVVFAVRGCWPAIAILLLLVPAIALGRWVYST